MWVAKENLFCAHCTWRYAGVIYPIAGLIPQARYKSLLVDVDGPDINDSKYRAYEHIHMSLKCFLLTESSVHPPNISAKNKQVTLSL